ncbi:MAG: DUF4468 domain-containing protein [Bacteroidetes bacterium]|nr:DUF4468 domain-containing protein [Bacteroidota bacterium]
MKKLYFLIFVLLIVNVVSAQDKLSGVLPLKDGKVIYSGIIQLQGVSKDEIYKRVKIWFINTYNSGKDVIQFDDKESGEIIGKGCFKEIWNINFFSSEYVNVWKTIKIKVKNDCLKYEITDIKIRNYFFPSPNASLTDLGTPIENWNKLRESNNKRFFQKIDDQLNQLMRSLENEMKNKVEDRW